VLDRTWCEKSEKILKNSLAATPTYSLRVQVRVMGYGPQPTTCGPEKMRSSSPLAWVSFFAFQKRRRRGESYLFLYSLPCTPPPKTDIFGAHTLRPRGWIVWITRSSSRMNQSKSLHQKCCVASIFLYSKTETKFDRRAQLFHSTGAATRT
jgi:hypothetical protein